MEDNDIIKVIHVMKDGTVRDSIKGVVIQNDEFYQVLAGILERKAAEECKQERGTSSRCSPSH